jgi:mono/diheme cytochrome c family protein
MSYVRGVFVTTLATLTFVTLLIMSTSLGAQAGAQTAAQAPLTVQDGVYSEAQARRGQVLYAQRCAGCHGPALAGASAPALTGDLFTNKFRMEPLSALFIQIRYAMPPKAEANAQLTSEQAADLVAHVLKSNGFPSGQTDFPAGDATNSPIGWPAGRGVGASSAPSPSWYSPTGNLAQLMRGVFFHNSNLIFSIQEVEAKDLPPQPPPTSPTG